MNNSHLIPPGPVTPESHKARIQRYNEIVASSKSLWAIHRCGKLDEAADRSKGALFERVLVHSAAKLAHERAGQHDRAAAHDREFRKHLDAWKAAHA